MRTLLVWLICISTLLATMARAGTTTYRNFTSKDGKTIRGAIKLYDPIKDTITVEREGGRVFTVPCGVFSEEDQSYIERWKNLEGIRNKSKFKISCDRRSLSDASEKIKGTVIENDTYSFDQDIGKMELEAIGYRLTIENMNQYPVYNISLEYCIYYEQETKPRLGMKKETEEGELCGCLELDECEARGTKTLITEAPIVYEYELNTDLVGSYVIRGSVKGIAIRIYAQVGDEKIFMREEATPSSVLNKRSWSTVSVDVGANVKEDEDN